jgi:hypothetical protein
MPAPVDETDVDPHRKEYSSEERQERRGILTNMLRRDGKMRFPEDEGEDEDVANEKAKGKAASPSPPLLHKTGSGESIGTDILPEQSPICALETKIIDQKGPAHGNGWGNGKDPRDVEFNRIARLTYRARREEQKQPIIQHQITCECLNFYLS